MSLDRSVPESKEVNIGDILLFPDRNTDDGRANLLQFRAGGAGLSRAFSKSHSAHDFFPPFPEGMQLNEKLSDPDPIVLQEYSEEHRLQSVFDEEGHFADWVRVKFNDVTAKKKVQGLIAKEMCLTWELGYRAVCDENGLFRPELREYFRPDMDDQPHPFDDPLNKVIYVAEFVIAAQVGLSSKLLNKYNSNLCLFHPVLRFNTHTKDTVSACSAQFTILKDLIKQLEESSSTEVQELRRIYADFSNQFIGILKSPKHFHQIPALVNKLKVEAQKVQQFLTEAEKCRNLLATVRLEIAAPAVVTQPTGFFARVFAAVSIWRGSSKPVTASLPPLDQAKQRLYKKVNDLLIAIAKNPKLFSRVSPLFKKLSMIMKVRSEFSPILKDVERLFDQELIALSLANLRYVIPPSYLLMTVDEGVPSSSSNNEDNERTAHLTRSLHMQHKNKAYDECREKLNELIESEYNFEIERDGKRIRISDIFEEFFGSIVRNPGNYNQFFKLTSKIDQILDLRTNSNEGHLRKQLADVQYNVECLLCFNQLNERRNIAGDYGLEVRRIDDEYRKALPAILNGDVKKSEEVRKLAEAMRAAIKGIDELDRQAEENRRNGKINMQGSSFATLRHDAVCSSCEFAIAVLVDTQSLGANALAKACSEWYLNFRKEENFIAIQSLTDAIYAATKFIKFPADREVKTAFLAASSNLPGYYRTLVRKFVGVLLYLFAAACVAAIVTIAVGAAPVTGGTSLVAAGVLALSAAASLKKGYALRDESTHTSSADVFLKLGKDVESRAIKGRKAQHKDWIGKVKAPEPEKAPLDKSLAAKDLKDSAAVEPPASDVDAGDTVRRASRNMPS